jgi:hypothetical protein
MKVIFTKHCDTSIGRVKIGSEVDLPTKEAKEFISNLKAVAVGKVQEEVVQEVVQVTEETE